MSGKSLSIRRRRSGAAPMSGICSARRNTIMGPCLRCHGSSSFGTTVAPKQYQRLGLDPSNIWRISMGISCASGSVATPDKHPERPAIAHHVAAQVSDYLSDGRIGIPLAVQWLRIVRAKPGLAQIAQGAFAPVRRSHSARACFQRRSWSTTRASSLWAST